MFECPESPITFPIDGWIHGKVHRQFCHIWKCMRSSYRYRKAATREENQGRLEKEEWRWRRVARLCTHQKCLLDLKTSGISTILGFACSGIVQSDISIWTKVDVRETLSLRVKISVSTTYHSHTCACLSGTILASGCHHCGGQLYFLPRIFSSLTLI